MRFAALPGDSRVSIVLVRRFPLDRGGGFIAGAERELSDDRDGADHSHGGQCPANRATLVLRKSVAEEQSNARPESRACRRSGRFLVLKVGFVSW